MTHKKIVSTVILTIVWMVGKSLHGQSAIDGAIGGTVEDETGSVISGATVVVHSGSTNAEQIVISDGSGFFRAVHLRPGVYIVTVSASGFETFRATAITVEVGSSSDLHAKLRVGAETTTVDVSTANPLINTASPEFSNTIEQKILEDLPVNNYRWSSYALLTPGGSIRLEWHRSLELSWAEHIAEQCYLRRCRR